MTCSAPEIWKGIEVRTRELWLLASSFELAPASPSLFACTGLREEALKILESNQLVRKGNDGRWQVEPAMWEFGRNAGLDTQRKTARRAFVLGCCKRSRGIGDYVGNGHRIYTQDQPHFDAAIRQAPTVLGEGAEEIARLADRIASAKHSLGEYSTARHLLEYAINLDRTHRGEDYPAVASNRSNLGLVLQALGNLRGARVQHELALQTDLRIRGEEHPEVAIKRSNLALVLDALGERYAAKKLLKSALDSDIRNLGEEHQHVAVRRSNLAVVLLGMNDLEAATLQMEKALKSDVRNYGENHPAVAIGHCNLAGIFYRRRDLPAAWAHARIARRIAEQQPEASDVRARVEDIVSLILDE